MKVWLQQLLRQEPLRDIPWSSWFDDCKRHQIAGFVATELQRQGYSLPPEWRSHLFGQAQHNLGKLGFLEELSQNLQHPWLLLKGPYLAEAFYGGLQYRQLGDIDMLVAPEDLNRVSQQLQGLGLQRRVPRLPWTWALHAWEWSKPGQSLDLHFRLRAWPWLNLDMKRLWSRSQNYRNWRVPHLHDSLLMHLLGWVDDLGRGELKYKGCLDLWLMARQLQDWPAFWDERRAEGTHELARQALGWVAREWGQLPRELHCHDALNLPGSALAARWAWARCFQSRAAWALSWWLVTLPWRWWAHR
jgi:hypothetical protein